MFITIHKVKLHYVLYGKGEPILLLHGWGGSMESLKPLSLELLKRGFRVLMLDLPGFGKSNLPKKAYTLDDYADIVETFVKQSFSGRVSVFGHSFGGSVSIKMAVRNNIKINKLILCNSSGIRLKKSVKVKLIQSIVKIVKPLYSLPILRSFYPIVRKLFYYYILRERDYIDHQDKKETLQKILSDDITPMLEKVTTPTLLIWGEKDKDTPVSHAKLMQMKMKNSKLKIFKHIGHGLPIQKPDTIANEISRFVINANN